VEHARSATADDVADLVELARHLRAELTPTRGGDLWAAHDVAGEPLEDVLRAAIASPDTLVVVGAIDDVPVGYGIVRVVDLRDGSRLGRVSELFVEPEARSVGVGEAIAGAVVEHCRGAGCRGVDVVALPGHRAAKNFFEEQGFTARAIVMHHTLADETIADQTDA
jgi:ribosomal protein S18 acetylase RimI-like enzyme